MSRPRGRRYVGNIRGPRTDPMSKVILCEVVFPIYVITQAKPIYLAQVLKYNYPMHAVTCDDCAFLGT